MDILSLLNNRVTCRNWLDQNLNNDTKEKILRSIELCPVKSGRIQWKLLVLDETKTELKKYLFNNNVVRDYIGDNVNYPEDIEIVSNPQVLSPFTLIWLTDYTTMDNILYYQKRIESGMSKDKLKNEFNRDSFVGISGQAFTAMFCAHSLGLDTGFFGCFSNRKISFLPEDYEAVLGLGIGYGTDPKRSFNGINYNPVIHPRLSEYLINHV